MNYCRQGMGKTGITEQQTVHTRRVLINRMDMHVPGEFTQSTTWIMPLAPGPGRLALGHWFGRREYGEDQRKLSGTRATWYCSRCLGTNERGYEVELPLVFSGRRQSFVWHATRLGEASAAGKLSQLSALSAASGLPYQLQSQLTNRPLTCLPKPSWERVTS